MFCKPRGNAATRHLFVGNCGPAVGLTEAQVQQFFEGTGAQAVTIPAFSEGASSHVFVTYQNAAQADAVLSALNDKPAAELGDRKLVIKFADRKSEHRANQATTQHVYRDAQICDVPGLGLHTDFVSPDEEKELLREVEAGPWEILARRRVQHFGYKFEYVTRNVDTGKPITPLPALARQLACRLEQLLGCTFDQLTVNEYEAGVGLSAHVDTHSAFTGPLLSLSLGGSCVMELRRGTEQRALFLPPRALLVMADEARYAWHHYIPHRRSDTVDGQSVPRAASRVSFTFRKVRGFPCNCNWPGSCDSQGGGMPPTRMALAAQGTLSDASSSAAPDETIGAKQIHPASTQQDGRQSAQCSAAALQSAEGSSQFALRNISLAEERTECEEEQAERSDGHRKEPSPQLEPCNTMGALPGRGCNGSGMNIAAQQMESRYVHGVYDIIASHFSATRFAIWPKVREFIESLPPSALVADVGCGNGKYFDVRPDLAVLGSDRSPNLAKTAAKRLLPCHNMKQSLPHCDVAVADGLHLPYRSGALDGVLCIAVLHHISTVERRIAMLAELARTLRCGGRALVTVWASEQEQPGKLAKWERIGQGTESSGGDYFVPWHVPFHRVEAAAAAAKARSGSSPLQREGSESTAPGALSGNASSTDVEQLLWPDSRQAGADDSRACSAAGEHFSREDGSNGVDAEAEAGGPEIRDVLPDGRVDRAKGTVVFKRYYHLYDKGELEGLVQRVPGIKLESSFFDKSNWCAIFQKV